MELKHNNYNQLLSDLFVDWIKSYPAEKRYLFCRDGIMLKNDPGINVDLLWEQSPRKVAFLLKDCPDEWGYDTRKMLLDEYGEEQGRKNRELEVPCTDCWRCLQKMLIIHSTTNMLISGWMKL